MPLPSKEMMRGQRESSISDITRLPPSEGQRLCGCVHGLVMGHMQRR